jgi:hypothetical protein
MMIMTRTTIVIRITLMIILLIIVPMISKMIRIVSMLQGSSSRMSTVSTGSAGTDFTSTLFMMKLFCKTSQYTVKNYAKANLSMAGNLFCKFLFFLFLSVPNIPRMCA